MLTTDRCCSCNRPVPREAVLVDTDKPVTQQGHNRNTWSRYHQWVCPGCQYDPSRKRKRDAEKKEAKAKVRGRGPAR